MKNLEIDDKYYDMIKSLLEAMSKVDMEESKIHMCEQKYFLYADDNHEITIGYKIIKIMMIQGEEIEEMGENIITLSTDN